MDRFRAMKVFVAVADAGSLSAAARELGEPLANVSRLLAQLEAELGSILIERTTRRMALTDAGRDYLKACRQAMETLDAAEGRIAGQAEHLSGEIAVTAPVSFGRLHVLPILAEFLAAYPRIDTRLVLIDRNVDLLDEDIDLAVRIGELADSGLLALRAGTLRLVTCAAPDLLKRDGTPAAPADLAGRDCIAFSGMQGARWVFKSRLHGRKSVRVHPRLTVNTADAAIDAAIAGLGITRVLSYQAEAAIRAGWLKEILPRFEDTPIPIHLVYRATRSDNPRVQRLVALAAERLRTRHQPRNTKLTTMTG
ncbi:MAG: LysR family transcriptional regulator [Hyphomicrobium sp.]|uniref:LysR family transcriptional regulator n=1 Tax=Hyphomicrobium sp. TaxID=82 RepID=UPI003D0E850D